MVRDRVAERRVYIASWLYWKSGAVIIGIFLLGAGVFLLETKKPPSGKELVEMIPGVALIAGMALICWWIGRSLDKFKSWARWTSAFLAGLNFVTNVLGVVFLIGYAVYIALGFDPEIPRGTEKMYFFLAFFGVYTLIYIISAAIDYYVLKATWGKGAAKVFSKEYQHRLQHDAFDRLEVTPR